MGTLPALCGRELASPRPRCPLTPSAPAAFSSCPHEGDTLLGAASALCPGSKRRGLGSHLCSCLYPSSAVTSFNYPGSIRPGPCAAGEPLGRTQGPSPGHATFLHSSPGPTNPPCWLRAASGCREPGVWGGRSCWMGSLETVRLCPGTPSPHPPAILRHDPVRQPGKKSVIHHSGPGVCLEGLGCF